MTRDAIPTRAHRVPPLPLPVTRATRQRGLALLAALRLLLRLLRLPRLPRPPRLPCLLRLLPLLLLCQLHLPPLCLPLLRLPLRPLSLTSSCCAWTAPLPPPPSWAHSRPLMTSAQVPAAAARRGRTARALTPHPCC
jgi:hypothetical protein